MEENQYPREESKDTNFSYFNFDLLNKKYLIFFLFIFAFITYFFFIKAPRDFKTDFVFRIEKGESLNKITKSLKENNLIKSGLFFQSFVIVLGGENKLVAGDYLFKEKENAITLALKIVRSDFGMKPVKLTIIEGLSRKEIADILEEKLVSFSKEIFLEESNTLEGYLFPDTYFFSPTEDISSIISKMNENYKNKISKFSDDIKKSGKTEKEIITMASILEGEAKDMESRQIVSGILWQRIKQKIPLQVDASFKYINGKDTFSLTLDDLKIKSPYNSYVNLGLPPTPINNPGEDAIYSSINPKKSPYLYFLTGKDGKMYYAKTFEEHKLNKQKYLR